jgi:sulfur-oxidizing protein SoxA
MMRGLRLALCGAMLAGAALDVVAADAEPPAGRRSGYDFMGRETRAMQDDDAANPATLWIFDGEAVWRRKAGAAAKSCADCHADAAVSMKGVAARHPAPDASGKKLLNLEQRINVCRTERQQAAPLAWESRDLLAITAYVGRQSRGMPASVVSDARSKPFIDAGRAAYNRRQGQLNLSCAQCHDDNAGRHLAGTPIPQAHPTGYPLYRLEWQGVGSLQRRLRNCLTGTRAENLPFGSPELVELEVFLMWRARGMPMETPAVRP